MIDRKRAVRLRQLKVLLERIDNNILKLNWFDTFKKEVDDEFLKIAESNEFIGNLGRTER